MISGIRRRKPPFVHPRLVGPRIGRRSSKKKTPRVEQRAGVNYPGGTGTFASRTATTRRVYT